MAGFVVNVNNNDLLSLLKLCYLGVGVDIRVIRGILRRLKNENPFKDKNDFNRFLVNVCGKRHLKNKQRTEWQKLTKAITIGEYVYKTRSERFQAYKPLSRRYFERSLFSPGSVEFAGENSEVVRIMENVAIGTKTDYDLDIVDLLETVVPALLDAIDERYFDVNGVVAEKRTKDAQSKVLQLPRREQFELDPQVYISEFVAQIIIPLSAICQNIVGRFAYARSCLCVWNKQGREKFAESLDTTLQELEQHLASYSQFGVDVAKRPMAEVIEDVLAYYTTLSDQLREQGITSHPAQWKRADDNHLLYGSLEMAPEYVHTIPDEVAGVALRLVRHAFRKINDQDDYDYALALWRKYGARPGREPRFDEPAIFPIFPIISPLPPHISKLIAPPVDDDPNLDILARDLLKQMRKEVHLSAERDDSDHDAFRASVTRKSQFERSQIRIYETIGEALSSYDENYGDEEYSISTDNIVARIYSEEMKSTKGSRICTVKYFLPFLVEWEEMAVPYNGIFVHPEWLEDPVELDYVIDSDTRFPLRYLYTLWGSLDKEVSYRSRFDPLFDKLEGRELRVELFPTVLKLDGHMSHATLVSLSKSHEHDTNSCGQVYIRRRSDRIIGVIKDAWGYSGIYKCVFEREEKSYFMDIGSRVGEIIDS